jgi:hypothetical protein
VIVLRRLRFGELSGIAVALLTIVFLAGSAPLMLGFIVVKSSSGPEIKADICHPLQSASQAPVVVSPIPPAQQNVSHLPQAGFVAETAPAQISEPYEPPESPPPKLPA